jgi:tetratricopeptide (TPR) repeat protein
MWRHLPAITALLLVPVADAQDVSPWVGQRVVTKQKTPLRVGGQVVDEQKDFRVYKVERVNGDWFWLVSGGASGWVRSGDVVLFDQAIDYFTQQIGANPGAANLYLVRGLIWAVKGKADSALADFNEAIRLHPKDAVAYNNRGIAWKGKKEYDKAIADYDEAIHFDPKYAVAYNNRAWLWATCPDEKYRDGKKAVEDATRACEMSGWKDVNSIDTLAASYAEAGDFDKAVEWQGKANSLYADSEDRKKGEERLKLYKDGRPYRDEG